jgi:hypothetical protein
MRLERAVSCVELVRLIRPCSIIIITLIIRNNNIGKGCRRRKAAIVVQVLLFDRHTAFIVLVRCRLCRSLSILERINDRSD